MEHAHYSFKLADNNLEGTYYEDGEDGEPTKEMTVRVLFDSPSEGSFQLAKVQVAPATKPEDWDDEENGVWTPTPTQQPEPKTAFHFAFRPQSDGRVHISETKWLGKDGGSVQFLALDDAFVFSKVGCADGSPSVTAWTAARKGAPRSKSSSGAKEPGKRSMLQKYGWYLLAAMGYTGYQAAKGAAGGAAAAKKSK